MRIKGKVLLIIIVVFILTTSIFPTKIAAYSISASGGILMEQTSGRVLYEKNSHAKMRIASITKIMTAIIAIESGKMDELVTISKRAVFTEGSSIYLQQGEKILLKDLVYGLMLRSGNDAANAIAEHVGGSIEGFVFLMNQKAEEIGMLNTIFSNPHGLDDHENHYSSAYDMAILTRYAMNHPTFKEISSTKVYKFERETGVQAWRNKNRLLTEKYKYTTGGKTGFTKRAGRTLVTTATKNELDLIAVTINAPDDWNDHIRMYEDAFKRYQLQNILKTGPLNIKVDGINKSKAELYINQSIRFPLAEGENEHVKLEYKFLHPNDLAKKRQGTVGYAILHYGHEPVQQVPIYIKEKQPQPNTNWWQQLIESLFGKIGMSQYD